MEIVVSLLEAAEIILPVLTIRVAVKIPELRVCVRFAAQQTKLDPAHTGTYAPLETKYEPRTYVRII